VSNERLRQAGHRTGDSELGSRFRRAGLVTVGKTNVPEFGMTASTQPVAFGATRNPWAPDRSTNGSSGGSCAAVAAKMVPLAHANDGAGSIRMPASWCGVVGFKPSRGRVPTAPGLTTLRFFHEFAVCRTIRDAAHLLDAVHGPVPGGLYWISAPPRRFHEELDARSEPLHIACVTEHPHIRVDQACVEAVTQTARLLDELGHYVTVDTGLRCCSSHPIPTQAC